MTVIVTRENVMLSASLFIVYCHLTIQVTRAVYVRFIDFSLHRIHVRILGCFITMHNTIVLKYIFDNANALPAYFPEGKIRFNPYRLFHGSTHIGCPFEKSELNS